MKVDKAIRETIERLPEARPLSAKELLRLPAEERDRYIRAACEKAAPLYAADLALPPEVGAG